MPEDNRGPLRQALRALAGGESIDEPQIWHAAWVARCVGRGLTAPLLRDDVAALAGTLETAELPPGAVLFATEKPSPGVWIVCQGQIELAVGTGRRRAVVDVLRPGDVDGDISLLLDMPLAYTARALTESTCHYLDRAAFEHLLASRPAIARSWLSSVAQRVSASQVRIINLLGRTLQSQVALLLLDEASEGSVQLAQRTVAAMLGVQRPSLNKILEEFERDGLITIHYAGIAIVDPDRLKANAGE